MIVINKGHDSYIWFFYRFLLQKLLFTLEPEKYDAEMMKSIDSMLIKCGKSPEELRKDVMNKQ